MVNSEHSGYTILDSRVDLDRKKRLLTILMGFCISVLIILGAVALMQDHLLLAFSDWLLALHFTGNTIYLHRSGNVRAAAWIGLICLGALFLFLLIDGGVAYTGFVWTLVYPLLTIYMLGWKRGAIVSGLVLVSFVVVRVFFPQFLGGDHPYSWSFMIRFVAAAGVATFVASYMDLSWCEAQRLIEKKNELLQNLNRLDALTGIYNRRHFDEELEKHWSHARRTGTALSLLLVDMDHFERYNEKHGQRAGDQALISVAMVLSRQASRKMDVAARYGGEEFAIILPGTGFGGAVNVSRWALRKIGEIGIEHPESAHGRLTASIGIACYDQRHEYPSHTELLEQAHGALTRAKKRGRNNYQPNPRDKRVN